MADGRNALMPDQPSKESLERARKSNHNLGLLMGKRGWDWAYIADPNDEADAVVAIEFDAIAAELRQQNAALVSALRLAVRYSYHRFVCASRLLPPNKCNCGYKKMLDDTETLLTPYVPAEEAQGKEK